MCLNYDKLMALMRSLGRGFQVLLLIIIHYISDVYFKLLIAIKARPFNCILVNDLLIMIIFFSIWMLDNQQRDRQRIETIDTNLVR